MRNKKQIRFCIPPKPAFRLDRSAGLALLVLRVEPGTCNKDRRAGPMPAPPHTRRVWTSKREMCQILQPPRGMDEIAQTSVMKNLDNSIYKKMSLCSPSPSSNTSKAMKCYWMKVDWKLFYHVQQHQGFFFVLVPRCIYLVPTCWWWIPSRTLTSLVVCGQYGDQGKHKNKTA